MKNDRTAIWIFFVLLLVVGGMFMLFRANSGYFERSVFGNAGLTELLKSHGVAVTTANPRIARDQDDFERRILPIQTTFLENRLTTWLPSELQFSERKMSRAQYLHKIKSLPTLVIFPKWSAEYGNQSSKPTEQVPLMISIGNLQSLMLDAGLESTTLKRGGLEFVSDSGVTLFAPQYFEEEKLADNCEPIFSTDYGHLIISCSVDDVEHPVLFVSDPDIFNNHGLSISDNSLFAVNFIENWIQDGQAGSLYMDTVSQITLSQDRFKDERQDYERTTSDFARMLEYPVNVILGLTLLIFGILFWRGFYRFGQARSVEEEFAHKNVSSRASLEASAHLMRLSGNDVKIAADFVRQHLSLAAVSLLGEAASQKPIEQLFSYLSAKKGKDAQEFIDCANQLMNPQEALSPNILSQKVNTYKTLAKKVIDPNEFE